MYEDIFLENEKKRGRERERGRVGGFWFLIFFIGGILTLHVGEASIKNCKIWTCEITLLSIFFFLCDRKLICLFSLFLLIKRVLLISGDTRNNLTAYIYMLIAKNHTMILRV